MVYDPVNGRLVGREEFAEDGAAGREIWADDVIALDLTTREWIVLLEPAAAQPAPSP